MEMKETQPTSAAQEQPAVYQNAEVVTAQTPTGETGSTNVIGDAQGKVANDMAPAQSASAMPTAAAPVTAVTKKPTMTFAQFREKQCMLCAKHFDNTKQFENCADIDEILNADNLKQYVLDEKKIKKIIEG